jgi:hypothetical protein
MTQLISGGATDTNGEEPAPHAPIGKPVKIKQRKLYSDYCKHALKLVEPAAVQLPTGRFVEKQFFRTRRLLNDSRDSCYLLSDSVHQCICSGDRAPAGCASTTFHDRAQDNWVVLSILMSEKP